MMKFFKLDKEITTEEYKEHMKEVFERIEQDQKVYFKGSEGMSILNKLDKLIASVRGSKPDMLLMSRRSWSKIQSLLQAKGDKMAEFIENKDGTITCKCGKSMHKVTFPDIGLCWSCSDPKCREYIVIDDEESE